MEKRIQEIIDNGYSFKMGRYLSGGWDIFKNGAGSFVGFFFLSLIITYASLFLLMLPVIGIMKGEPMSGAVLALIVILGLVWTILLGALFNGYLSYSRSVVLGEPSFGEFFALFRQLPQLIVYFIIYFLCLLPFYIILIAFGFPYEAYLEMIKNPENIQVIAQQMQVEMEAYGATYNLVNFLVNVATTVIFILFALAIPLMIDRKMPAVEAIRVSMVVMKKKIPHFLGFYILVYLGMILGGLITCFLGLIVLVPLFFCINYAIYDEIIGTHGKSGDHDMIDEFGTRKQDINTEREEESQNGEDRTGHSSGTSDSDPDNTPGPPT